MKAVGIADVRPDLFRSPVVAIGIFDGFHLGHVALLSRLLAWGKEKDRDAVVLTFRRHPKEVLAGPAHSSIMSFEHRLLWFRRLALDGCVVMDFTPETASMSAERFVREVLLEGLGVSGILLGHDSRFGAGREGCADFIRDGGYPLEVRTCPVVAVDGVRPSSTLIRRLIREGRLDRAVRLLGHNLFVYGPVVEGAGRGRAIGFPTANVLPEAETLPPDGVYGVRARLHDEREFLGVANVGPRPTFRDASGPPVEVHLLDFDEELYGRKIEVEVLCRLRGGVRFPDAASLAEQIRRDIARFREYLSHGGRETA